TRNNGRRPDELRPLDLLPDYLEQPHGSVLFSQGKTKVLCTASIQEGVPRWLYGKGRGWLTAEYSLLPASTGDRTEREASRGKQGGRPIEIQRLIGRSIRAVTDFDALGERTLWVDCDVLQADGGTRCAAISGAYVAAKRALDRFGLSKALTGSVAAVSVGIVEGAPLLDLDYSEDSTAEVDMNVVITGSGELVEVQATAERTPFSRASLDELLELAAAGIEELATAQDEAVAAARVERVAELGRSAPAACSRGRSGRRDRARTRAARARGWAADAPARRGRIGALHDRRRVRLRVRADGSDEDRRADRDGHRFPRRGRDHPARLLDPRPDDRS